MVVETCICTVGPRTPHYVHSLNPSPPSSRYVCRNRLGQGLMPWIYNNRWLDLCSSDG
jgi:hypothetical protein